MNNQLIRSLAAAAVLVFSTSILHAADQTGTRVELKALPDFVQRVFVPTLPEQENVFRIDQAPIDTIVSAPAGFRVDRFGGGVRIFAPKGEAAGYVTLRAGNRTITLTVINLVPYTVMQAGLLNGYHIGEYLIPMKNRTTYERPRGFMRLTPANRDLFVSDHYRLRDFQCKLDGESKYLILRTEALVKLELLQHILETRHGLKFTRFVIMSGYRTPFYNRIIGNETSYSRHLYGDAMDIYIDEDHDGNMDDINHDGRIDSNDAKFLLTIAEAIDRSTEWGWLKGGAGVYHATSAHGPYLHVDARGYVARWGV
jgi:hypothetical protein